MHDSYYGCARRRYVQELCVDVSAEKFKAMMSVMATVIRDGRPHEIPLKFLVPGDIILLSASDMVPADVRLIAARDLFVNQATLTGEGLPAEKAASTLQDAQTPLEASNICFG